MLQSPTVQELLAVRIQGQQTRELMAAASSCVLLGRMADIPVFAIDVSALGNGQPPILSEDTEWQDLRQCGGLLSSEDAGLLAYARAMLHWHRTQRYCGYCGSKTRSSLSGHVRNCLNPDCAKEWFPRTDPAVIMRIEYYPVDHSESLILLGRQSSWPQGAYSVLAGFVDPGESLEQTVAREVFEEAGVQITDITYLASQPWPFPASLMLGFKALAVESKLDFSSHELQHAAWFSRQQLANFGEWGDPGSGPKLPRADSISRRLIDDWSHDNSAT